jgi:hypothetical protein
MSEPFRSKHHSFSARGAPACTRLHHRRMQDVSFVHLGENFMLTLSFMTSADERANIIK